MINLRKLKESIVLITSASDRKLNVIGTGFAFYRQEDYTYLLTCAHVVEDVGGEENLRVNDIPVELVEIGDAQGFDLAILKVKYIFPPLTLMILYGEQERSFEIKIPGNFLMGENKARRRQIITGIMMLDGETALQTIDNKEEEVTVGKLKIDKGELQKGYSGAPVVDLDTGFVVGVTTHQVDKEGSFGTAISVEALEKIWHEMPTEVSQQIERESLESSDDLSIEETPVESVENSDNLSVEETPVESVENSEDLSSEETPVESVENSEDLSSEETPVESVENSDNLSVEETPVESLENSEDLSSEEIIALKKLDVPKNLPAQQITPFDVIKVNSKGEEISRLSDKAPFFTEDLVNGVILEMIYIPGGTFMMGSPENEEGRRDKESPQHQVTLQPFYMSKYLITQSQYKAIMGKNPSYFKGGKRPVECVSWYDAAEFCQKLSQETGKNYELPSESQWEYVCRAGTTTPFYFGETITSELVNFNGNYTYADAPKGKFREQTTDVGSFPPNAFGLYDMHGNVWEWCADDWHKNYKGAPSDGTAWLENEEKEHYTVLRGGSWLGIPTLCRSAFRNNYNRRDDHDYFIGFRVVCDGGITL